ncbi:MAG: cytochrome c biogenesis protein CcdA [Actinobacteria bacterium]|nr:cytochrome c biogenesis protein CcdA [Actinomycetota bacterium]
MSHLLASGTSVVADGSLLVAIGVALLAGVVSFLSPCVLPLVPGYLSYVTGLTGAELGVTAAGAGRRNPATDPTAGSAVGVAVVAREVSPPRPALRHSRVLLGTVGFVLGFSAVFVAYGALFGTLGGWLLEYQEAIQRILGVAVIVLGLSFAGWLPGMNSEWRLHMAPRYGLWGAPLLGLLFGLGWTPCIGPTLAAVQSLAFSEGSALRGAILSLAYCIGLGVPFIALGFAFERLAGALGWVRRHYSLVMRVGGVLLIAIGVALVTGLWTEFMVWARVWAGGFEVAL